MSGALLGAVGAFVERELNEGWLLLAAFLAVSALVVVSYTTTAARGELGITTEVTALLAFIVGALCGWDKVGVASVATMVCLLLLTLKDYLHRLARRVELEDVEATLKFAVISVIILPLLRNEAFGPPPLNVINPYKIWLMVVLIRGVEFFGLRAGQSTWERARAPRDGDPRRPGVEPSTAVTLSFSQRSRQEPAMSSAFVLAICHRCALEHTGQGGHGSVSGIPPLRRTLLLATFLVLIAAIVGVVIVGRAS